MGSRRVPVAITDQNAFMLFQKNCRTILSQ